MTQETLVSPSVRDQSHSYELRERSASLLSLMLLGGGLVGTWLVPPDSLMLRGRFAVFASLLLEGLIAYALRQRAPWATRAILLLGPAATMAHALRVMPGPLVPCYAALAVLANTAIKPRQGLIATLIHTLLILSSRPVDGSLLSALALLWSAAAIEWVSSGALHTALDWLWGVQQGYNAILQQLRDRQGELNRTLAALKEATYRLQRTNHELDIALREAEEARQAKQRFVANISHELRTPLNIIIGYAEMLCTSPESYGDTPWPPALRDDLLTIWRNAEHLLKMVDDVLDLAQIEAARLPILPEPTDPLYLIRNTLQAASALFHRAGLDLRTSLPEGLPTVNVDRTRIRQVLLNLISNAVRHTSEGYVEVGARLSDGEVLVYVRDTGEGIPADKLEAIFEEFEQVDVPTRRAHKGVGLGLAISRHFIRLHGGRIWAESQLGEGSTFFFTLPLPQQRAALRPSELLRTARQPLSLTSERQRLVVLCRDPSSLRLLERHLEGMAVVPARTTGEAVTAVVAEHPEIVVAAAESPADLPETLELGRALREALAPLDCPIVVCSIPTERQAGLSLGVEEFLTKPVTDKDIAWALERVCPQPRRILVVDDERDMLRLLARMIRHRCPSAEVRAVGSGMEAIASLDWRPDVVFLDLLMPEVSGVDVLRAMRSRPETAGTPAVAVTSRTPAEELGKIEAGEIHVLRNGGFGAGEVARFVQLVAKTLPPHYASARASGQHNRRAEPVSPAS